MSTSITQEPPTAVRRVLAGAVLGAALAASATLATTASAAASPAPPVRATLASAAATASPDTPDATGKVSGTATMPTGPARAGALNTVKVTDALLRAQPNTSSTKLDVSQPGRVVDLYCWHDYTDSSHYVWFKAHPHGSKYTGWMRADLINWATYPNPGRC
jgi:hypothetical protein